jgi:putative ABC transport system permease protein
MVYDKYRPVLMPSSKPIERTKRPFRRAAANARLGLRMMFHDRPKLLGTLSGVVFSVVLVLQQLATLFGLVGKNTMFVENAGADIWIAPKGTIQLQASGELERSVLDRARSVDGVAEAEPLVFASASMARPKGGSEPMTLVGSPLPSRLGAPWNVIAGRTEDLDAPDTIMVDDSARKNLGDVNMGSVREVSGRRVRVVGLTWGLQPFAPAYAFTDIALARTLSGTREGGCQFVLVRTRPGESSELVATRLRRALPDEAVMTRTAFRDGIVRTLLVDSALGISFGFTATFGLIVGFVIVALTMYSAVLDNLRELGTLKAIGCRNGDLTRLVLVQASVYGLGGSFVGLGLGAMLTSGIRSEELSLVVPKVLFLLLPPVMLLVCATASLLSLRRIRKLEPAMVFR